VVSRRLRGFLDDDKGLTRQPVESGVLSTQAKATPSEQATLGTVVSSGAYAEYPLSDAVRGIGEFGVRGQSAMMLLLASVRRLERDLKEAREELRRFRDTNETLQKNLVGCEKTNSVISERLANSQQQRWVRSVLTTLGGIVAGVSIPHVADPNPGYAIAATFLAVLLLASGWLLPFRGTGDLT